MKYNNPLILLLIHFINSSFKVLFVYLTLELPQLLVRSFDNYFLQKGSFVFDFMILRSNDLDFLEHGIYFAILVSLLCIIFISRLNFPNFNSKYSIDFVAILIILFFGISLSIYSVSNAVFYYINSETLLDWYNTEKQNNLILLRINSLTLSYQIFNSGFSHLNKTRLIDGFDDFSYGKLSPFYLSQVGYYVFMIITLFYTHHFQSNFISGVLLNWSLFVIITDWTIIYDYYRNFHRMLKRHYFKLLAFNILTFIFAVIFFFQTQNFYILTIFIVLCLLLILFFYNGKGAIKTQILE